MKTLNKQKNKWVIPVLMIIMLAFGAATIWAENAKTARADSPVWNGTVATSYAGGTGTSSNPWLISTAEQLAYFRQEINAGRGNSGAFYYALTDNIILNSNAANYANWGATPPERKWTPIGISTSYFNANFDGRGYVVRGIYTDPDLENQGFFGYIGSGKVNNVGVEQSYIRGIQRSGAVAGSITSGGIVRNCFNKGIVNASSRWIGGVVGVISNGYLDYCYNTGAVTGVLDPVGGVLGELYTGAVTNSYNTGAVRGSTNVGGVVGYIGYSGNGCYVTNCYNTGTVYGTGVRIGGVVGSVKDNPVRNLYNIGNVSGGNYIGGVVGGFEGAGSLSYGYWLAGTAAAAVGNIATGTSTNTASFNTSGTLSPSINVNGTRTTLQAAVSNWAGWTAGGGYVAPPAGVTYAAWNSSTYPSFVALTVTNPVKYNVSFGIYNSVTGRGTISASIGGAAATISGQPHQTGAAMTFTAAPAAGWVVMSWRNGTTVVQSKGNTYSTTLTAAANITVEFEAVYNITFSAGGGTGGGASPATGIAGAQITLTRPTAPANREFYSWSVTGTGATVNNSTNVLTMGTAHVTVTAIWGARVNFSVLNSAGGTLSAASGGSGTLIQAGTSTTLTAAPSANWRVKQWWRDGNVVQTGTSTTYTVSNIQAHTSVEVEFEMAIAYLPGANGVGVAVTNYKTFDLTHTVRGAAFTRTGYNQTGWNTADDGTGVAYNFGSSYSANVPVTLYPVWTAISGIIVSFDTQSDMAYDPDNQPLDPSQPFLPLYQPDTISVTFDSPYGALPAVKRYGFIFGGWWTKDGTLDEWGAEIAHVTLVNNENAHTLYAKWLENEIPIMYYDVGGEAYSGSKENLPSSFDAATGIEIVGPVRDGHTFLGWFYDSDAATPLSDSEDDGKWRISPGDYDDEIEYIEIYAKWYAHTYTVIYNANKPSAASAANHTGVTDQSAHQCGSASQLTLNGYGVLGWSFTGWNTRADGSGITYTDRQSVLDLTYENNGNVNLYAVWTRNYYSVIYQQNKPNAASANVAQTMTASQHIYDNTLTETLSPNLFSLTGWTFLGWMLQADGALTSPQSSYVIYTDGAVISNLTSIQDGKFYLYAVWRPNTYTVIYDGNKEYGAQGSSGLLANYTQPTQHTYDEYRQLRQNGYTLTGWHFNQWRTETGLTGTAYGDEASVSNLTAVDGGTVTLYARWARNTYYIEYNSNLPAGASGKILGSTAASHHEYDVRQALTQGGYSLTGWSFVGWARNPDGSGTLYSDQQNVLNVTQAHNAKITLYARWSANVYTIEYNKNNADAVGSTQTSSHVYDSSKRLSYNGFSLAGHEFLGWATSPAGSALYVDGEVLFDNLTDVSNKTVTLYAVWSAKLYSVTFALPWEYEEGSSEPVNRDIVVYARYGDRISADSLKSDVEIPDAPYLDGMLFARWDGLPLGQYANQMTVTGDHIFTAVYVPAGADIYTIRFEHEDGTPIVDPQNVKFGMYISEFLPPEPGMDGFTFIRWEGYEQWMTVTGDHTFTAIFKPGGATLYTVTFYDIDGSVVVSKQAGEGTVVSTLFPAVKQLEGFVFTGWTGYTLGMTVTGDHFFTADYLLAPVPSYTVIFYAEDGFTPILRLDNVPKGTMVSTLVPRAPVIPNKTFIRWDGLGNWMTVESNHAFYAVYYETESLKYYTVSFWDDDGSLISEIQLVTIGTPVASLFPVSNPVKPGYVFTGWKGYIANMTLSGNLSLYATYTRAPAALYTVQFLDRNGSIFYQATNVPYGTLISMIVPPAAPAVEGYTFVRWDGYESWMTVVTSNHLFQAVYRAEPVPRNITVTFYDEDALTVIAVRRDLYQGTSISALFPQTPIKANKVFVGWYYQSNSGEWVSYVSGLTAENDMEFKAVYAADVPANKYTVTFRNFDDSLIIEYNNIPSGTQIALLQPAAPPRQGYAFAGWEYLSQGSWIPCPADLTIMYSTYLRAVYSEMGAVYNLIVNGQLMGYYKGGTSVTVYIDIPDKSEFMRWEYISGIASLPTPSAIGKVSFEMPNENVAFNAVFRNIPEYVVFFNTNGATSAMPSPQLVLEGSKIAPVKMPEREFHIFRGWYFGEELWDFATDTVTGNMIVGGIITLTAKWESSGAAAYQLILTGGIGSGYYLAGTMVTIVLEIPDGMEFNGNWTNPDGVYLYKQPEPNKYMFMMPFKPVTLTANYDIVPVFKVTFDFDNGSGITLSYDRLRGQTIASIYPVAWKAGYTFSYWYYVDGTNKVKFDHINDKVMQDLYLFADYTPNSHIVMIEGGGYELIGTKDSALNSDNIYYGSEVKLIFDGYEPEGKIFLRFTSSDVVILYNTESDYYYFIMPDFDVIITANYGDNSLEYHMVTFDLNNGSGIEVQYKVGDGERADELAPPAKTGYKFEHWYLEGEDPLTPFEFDTIISGNIKLKAYYTQNSHFVTVIDGGYELLDMAGEAADGRIYYGFEVRLIMIVPPDEKFIRFISADAGILYNEEFDYYYFIMPDRDVIITACYEDAVHLISYTVTFDFNNGSGIKVLYNVSRNDTISALPPPSAWKTGYEFTYWFFINNEGDKEIFAVNTPVTSDLVLYAAYMLKSYDAKVENGGYEIIKGGEDAGGNIYYGSEVKLIFDGYEPEGKIFLRFTSSDVVILYNTESDYYYFIMPDFDVIITANYGDNSLEYHMVTFDLNNGSGIEVQYKVGDGERADELAPPAKTGYKFEHWYLEGEDPLTPFEFDTIISENIKLKAYYTQNSHFVTVIDGGYELLDMAGEAADGRIYYGFEVRLIIQEPEGKWFVRFISEDAGILYDSEGKYFYFIMPDREVTITALYEDEALIVFYTVTFDLNNSSGITKSVSVRKDYPIDKDYIPAAQTEGHDFVHWYVDGESENIPFDFDTAISGNIILKAFYTPKSYTVTVNGGSYKAEQGEDVPDGKVYYGSTVVLIDDPADGWQFVGYISSGITIIYDEDGDYYYFIMPAHDVNITVGYELKPIIYYTVIFSLNNGTGVTEEISVLSGDLLDSGLLTIVPYKSQYRFVHWYLSTGLANEELVPFDFETTLVLNDMLILAYYVEIEGFDKLTVKEDTNKFEFIYFDEKAMGRDKYIPIDREEYIYDENKTVFLINVAAKEFIGTILSQFLNYLNKPGSIRVLYSDGSVLDESLYGSLFSGTGMIIQLLDGGVVIDSVTVVVKGDADGDGELTIVDTAQVSSAARGVKPIKDAFYIAADVDGDGDISIIDTAQVASAVRGVTDLHKDVRIKQEG